MAGRQKAAEALHAALWCPTAVLSDSQPHAWHLSIEACTCPPVSLVFAHAETQSLNLSPQQCAHATSPLVQSVSCAEGQCAVLWTPAALSGFLPVSTTTQE